MSPVFSSGRSGLRAASGLLILALGMPGTRGEQTDTSDPPLQSRQRLRNDTLPDDRRPTLWVLDQVAEEPATGTIAVAGRAGLSRVATEDVRFVVTAIDGTARAGTDFTPLQTDLVIPAGQLAVTFVIELLADAALEGDETFAVRLSRVDGAEAWPADATWTIRDASLRRPAVLAEGTTVYEGVGPVPLSVRFVETGTPFAVPWSLEPVAVTTTASGGPLPTFGVDLAAGQSGRLLSGPDPSTAFHLSAERDHIRDPDEPVSAIFTLPDGVVAGSFARRFAASLDTHTFGQPVRATTDGQRVVVIERDPAGDGPGPLRLAVYGRNPSAPGGWKRVHSWPAPTTGNGRSMDIRLRQGRLMYYDGGAGRAWVYAAPAAPQGAWPPEADFPAAVNPDLSWLGWDFDGATFVVAHANAVFFRERGPGDWSVSHAVETEGGSGGPAGRPVLDGPRCAVAVSRPGSSPAVQIIERAGPPLTPWVPRATIPHPDSTNPARPLLLGRFLAIGRTGETTTRVHEQAPDGSWPLRQILADELLFAGPSLFFGTKSVHAVTGTSESPWQPLGRSSWSPLYDTSSLLDVCGHVLLQRQAFTGADDQGIPGFSISEPGVEAIIGDEQSFEFSHRFAAANTEGPTDLAYASVLITPMAPAPLPITLRYRTDTTGGSATAGTDFRPVEGQITLPAGATGAWVRVPVLPDAEPEPAESIVLLFDPPSYGAPSLERVELYVVDAPLGLTAPDRASRHLFEPAEGTESLVLPFSIARPQRQDIVFHYEINRPTFAPNEATDADVVLGTGSGILRAGSTAVPVPVTVRADALDEGPEIIEIVVMLPHQQPYRFSAEVTVLDHAPPGTRPDAWPAPQGAILPPAATQNVLANDPAGFPAILPGLPALTGHVEPLPDGTFRYTPATNALGPDRWAYRGSRDSTLVLPENATWKWLHPLDGRDPDLDQPGFGTQWMRPDFDDSQWSDGSGLMGCGTLGAEPGQAIDTDLGNPPDRTRHPTAYFRTRFAGPPAPAPGLFLRFSCADGAIFYLNGTEIGRHAPAPLLGFATAPDTYALVTGKGQAHGPVETRPISLFFPNATVLPGPNTLAISLHNGSPFSPDLGLQVFEVTTGQPTAPVRVDITVTDTAQPPVLHDDSYSIPTTTTPLDSLFFTGGSAYTNDGLIAPEGIAWDPVLEVETGGHPVGPVRFDRTSGHFTIDAPKGFFGSTSFTYRVRDKDGWSQPATVSLSVSPSRAFDRWRVAEFGGDWSNPLSAPAADGDGDGRPNLMEFALGSSPATGNPESPLALSRPDARWAVTFSAATGFGHDVFIDLEQTPSLANSSWQRVARLNDAFPHLEVLAPGVTRSLTAGPDGLTRCHVSLPPDTMASSFIRLRVTREADPMVP